MSLASVLKDEHECLSLLKRKKLALVTEIQGISNPDHKAICKMWKGRVVFEPGQRVSFIDGLALNWLHMRLGYRSIHN